jgi:hypothetical protein
MCSKIWTMALVCGNCGGDLALFMQEDPPINPNSGTTVEYESCGLHGVIAASY